MNRQYTPRKSLLAIAVAAAGLQITPLGSVALAQTGVEEILVTATRREQKVQDIPFNISAVSGESLEKANIVDAVDALRTMAGISVQDRGYRNGGVTSSIVIRGINVDSSANGDVPLAAPPTVATYIDNTALYGNFILKDIDRVEVLRGPQGTLYGSGSLAGNVRYIMNKPDTSEFSGKASLGYGVTEGSGGYNLNPDILLNIPLSDTFALRLNAGQIDNDGVVDYPNVYQLDANGDPVVSGGDILNATPVYTKVKDADDVDIKYVRASALFAPNDTFSAQLSYQRQEDDVGARRQITHGRNRVNGGFYDDDEFGAIQLEPSEREVELVALEMEVDLGFATLTSSTSNYEHTGTGISDNSGVYARNRWFRFYNSSPRPIAQAERFYDDSALAQELRLVSNGDNFIDWTVGLYYTDQDYDLGQNSYLVGYLPFLQASNWAYYTAGVTTNQDFLFRRDQTYKETAAFGEFTINFTDCVHLTLGGRYFDNEVEVDAIVDIPIYRGSILDAPPGVSSENISENDFLFKANFAWDLNDDSMVYATFSQGYRHAGANAIPLSGKYAENPELITFDSDSLDNYELGFKGSTGNLNYTAALYYTDWQNPQLNSVTSNWGFFAAINGESASTQGIELELSGALSEHLSFSLGYTYADSELTDDVYQPAGNYYGGIRYDDRVAADGDRLPGTSEHVFNVSLSYDFTFANGIEVVTVLSGYYQSDSINAIGDDNCLSEYRTDNGACRDSANPTSGFYRPTSIYSRTYSEIEDFQIWNLSSTFSKDAWGVSLYVKNLGNVYATTGEVPFQVAGSDPSAAQNYFGNNSRHFIAQPRTIGASLSFSF